MPEQLPEKWTVFKAGESRSDFFIYNTRKQATDKATELVKIHKGHSWYVAKVRLTMNSEDPEVTEMKHD